MSQCIVKNCKSVFIQRRNGDKQSASNVTFHFIPKDPIKRKKWLEALGLRNVRDRARICSNHFSEDAFDRTSSKLIRLREHAVPNICVAKSNKKKANTYGTETHALSEDDSQDLSDSDSVIEDITIHTISEDEINVSEKEPVESPVKITEAVADVSNICNSTVLFYFGDGDVPGQAPFTPKPRLEKTPSALPSQESCSQSNSQSITCSPPRKPIENEPELPPCETCGTKKKRSMERATSVSPERIFQCPVKKRIREHYENEIRRYKQKMRGLKQKVRRLEENNYALKLIAKVE